ncbi:Hypothetical predicted protein [Octopus vulgaris]|uniref:Uncharacterized protein n=1 Tax=Octopus vulgaris TaxID=6645 RepID=A0AA36AQZ5_OCTVU|nr:Hypothetical predicted protein [Octopus vulgaris]
MHSDINTSNNSSNANNVDNYDMAIELNDIENAQRKFRALTRPYNTTSFGRIELANTSKEISHDFRILFKSYIFP